MGIQPEFDEIGYWSEIKLEILKDYASAYSKILAAQRNPALEHVYIDAFAGAGMHLTKLTKNFVPGSPLNALWVQPPFREYHLIDIAPERVESLRSLIQPREDVSIYQGDCNRILLDSVFPRVHWKDYRRGLCVLDPYGLDLDWSGVFAAGGVKKISIFFKFSLGEIKRNIFLCDLETLYITSKTRCKNYMVSTLLRKN